MEDGFQNQQTRRPKADLPEYNKTPDSAIVIPNRSQSTIFGRLRFTKFKFLTALSSGFRWLWANAPKKATQLTHKPEEDLSTDYYFQILSEDSIEKVFGCVFARLIRGIKTRQPFIIQQREHLPPGNMLIGTQSSGSSASGEGQDDKNESDSSPDDDGGHMRGLCD